MIEEHVERLHTIDSAPRMLDEIVHTSEELRTGSDALLMGESVQPLEEGPDVILSNNFHHEFLCCALSDSITSRERTHLSVPA